MAAAAAAAKGVRLHHIARETSDVKRLATFYQQVLGFEKVESPDFGDFEVVWLVLGSQISLHLIERSPSSRLAEGPCNSSGAVDLEPGHLPRGHHLAFAVENYASFVNSLKEKGIKVFETTQPDGKTKQVFFFDPDGQEMDPVLSKRRAKVFELRCLNTSNATTLNMLKEHVFQGIKLGKACFLYVLCGTKATLLSHTTGNGGLWRFRG